MKLKKKLARLLARAEWLIKILSATRKRKVLSIAVLLILYAAAIYLPAPAFHWYWFGLFYMNPSFWIVFFLAAVIFIRKLHKNSSVEVVEKYNFDTQKLENVPVRSYNVKKAVILGGLLLVGVISSAVLLNAHSKVILAQSTEPQVAASQPDTTQLRYLPIDVAENCAKSSLTNSQYVTGDFDPIESEGQNWVTPRPPSGVVNKFFGNTGGVAIIKSDCSATDISQPFKYGEGMYIRDNLKWQLLRRNYFADIPEIFYLVSPDKRDVIGVAPYLRFRVDYPTLVQVPRWGGVLVVHANGDIEDLSPEQAQKDPRLSGQRIYPEMMATKIAKSWQYRHGIFNAWFLHKDQAIVPDVKNSRNQMPYYLPTDKGPQWSIAFEPYGKTFGTTKLMFIDARSGTVNVYDLPQGASLLGVNAAEQFVRSSYTQIQWEKSDDTGGTIIALEPRPVVKDGDLYWMHSITNKEYANVSFTTLTNAANKEVRSFCSLDQLNRFLKGTFKGNTIACRIESVPEGQQTPPPPAQPTGPPTQSGQPQPTVPGVDVSNMSPEDRARLIQYLRQLADQLEKGQPAPTQSPTR